MDDGATLATRDKDKLGHMCLFWLSLGHCALDAVIWTLYGQLECTLSSALIKVHVTVSMNYSVKPNSMH